MRLASPIARHRARIEIVPLIDVMFFLLASFMMVSLSLQRLRTLKMDLPSATRAVPGSRPELLEVVVRSNGDISIDGRRHSLTDFLELVRQRVRADPAFPVYLKAEPDTAHGDVLRILDTARAAGATRVSFQLDSAADSLQ